MGFFNCKFHVIRPCERQGKGDFLSNTDPLHSFQYLPGDPYDVSQCQFTCVCCLMAWGESECVYCGKFHVIRPCERQRKGSNIDPLHSFGSLPGVTYPVSR